jgi:hypothetical protein
MNIPACLEHLRPGAEWGLTENDYASLEWIGPGEKPMLGEIEVAWGELQKAPPLEVTMTALRFALIDADLFTPVVNALNSPPDPKDKLRAQTWWTTAQVVERNHPLVAQVAAVIGKTDTDIDKIFAAAKTYQAAP